MIEDGIYIGIIKNRSATSDPVYRITISPLMEWDENEKNWIDIDKNRCQQLFPDRGLVVYFSDDPGCRTGTGCGAIVHFPLWR